MTKPDRATVTIETSTYIATFEMTGDTGINLVGTEPNRRLIPCRLTLEGTVISYAVDRNGGDPDEFEGQPLKHSVHDAAVNPMQP